MLNKELFIKTMQEGYATKTQTLILGKGKYDEEIISETLITIPLHTLNRHGLIAGATGTGKTKSLQILAEGLSAHGVPSLIMDIKGDISGLAAVGEGNEKIIQRMKILDISYTPNKFPVEFISFIGSQGVHCRSTISEFGPVLLSRILGLNEVQSGIISMIFAFCDNNQLPLVDLKDLKAIIQYAGEGGKETFMHDYGNITSASLATILRAIITLEQQGGEAFFGEPSFDIQDLFHIREGKGVINIIRLDDMQSKPDLFSTCMLSMLAELYHTLPEIGDTVGIKFAVFIDEAHLVFKEASKALLDQIETMMKLIRSKGVGIFFCTQLPDDIPDPVLSQLGLRIQHALRAITAKDREVLEKAVKNYPLTDFYTVDKLITELGIGEALITALDENGQPTPLVYTYMIAPASRMDILHPDEISALLEASTLVQKYAKTLNSDSAFELLSQKLTHSSSKEDNKVIKIGGNSISTSEKANDPLRKTVLESKPIVSTAKAVGNAVVRGLLGKIGIKVDGRRTWF